MNQPASAYFLEERHDPNETHTLSVLVQNEPGVLARVIGLFSGRGYNIESLTVSETESQKHLSRITIVTTGTPMVIEQIKHQLDRMIPVYRVVVNAPCSQGAAGFATHLPPSFTIGTGFAGRSSIGENLGPQHLVQWTRIAYAKDLPANLAGIDLSAVSSGRAAPKPAAPPPEPAHASGDVSRDELRRLILEELRSLKGGEA